MDKIDLITYRDSIYWLKKKRKENERMLVFVEEVDRFQ